MLYYSQKQVLYYSQKQGDFWKVKSPLSGAFKLKKSVALPVPPTFALSASAVFDATEEDWNSTDGAISRMSKSQLYVFLLHRQIASSPWFWHLENVGIWTKNSQAEPVRTEEICGGISAL